MATLDDHPLTIVSKYILEYIHGTLQRETSGPRSGCINRGKLFCESCASQQPTHYSLIVAKAIRLLATFDATLGQLQQKSGASSGSDNPRDGCTRKDRHVDRFLVSTYLILVCL
jgi:hypothetical protein